MWTNTPCRDTRSALGFWRAPWIVLLFLALGSTTGEGQDCGQRVLPRGPTVIADD